MEPTMEPTRDLTVYHTVESTTAPMTSAENPTSDLTNDLTMEDASTTEAGLLRSASWLWSNRLVPGMLATVLLLMAVGFGCLCRRKNRSAIPSAKENDLDGVISSKSHAVVDTATPGDYACSVEIQCFQ